MIRNGEILDNQYQIVKEIGAGGLGVIYLAYHLRLCKYVVLKKIKSAFAGQVNGRAEVDLLKSLHHAYLPQVYDYLQWGQDIYTVIDYIEGYDLEWYIRQGYQFSEEELAKWMRQMAEVLVYLHGQNPKVIHCDIKPANIIIDARGNAILIDFNISFLENASGLTGLSRSYASPEQVLYAVQMQMAGCSQTVVDERTDIYSLGATFYHLMTGMSPTDETRRQYPLSGLELPYSSAFCKIVSKSMEENKEQRYQTSKDLLKAVHNLRKSTWQHRLLVCAAALAVLLGATAITAGSIYAYRNGQEKNRQSFLEDYNQAAKSYELELSESQFQNVTDMLNNKKYENYFEENPEKKAMLLFFLADYYVDCDHKEAAEKYFEESIEVQGISQVYKEYAKVLAEDGQYTKAKKMLKKAALPEEEYGMLLAQFLCDEGQYQEAVKVAEKIEDEVKGEEKKTILKLELYCYQELGEKEKAKQYYDMLEAFGE